MTAIFHLSFPVTDLEESIRYYQSAFGAIPGRHGDGWADIALFGAQVTLQHVPEDVLAPMPRARHFGATLTWDEWERLTGCFTTFVEPPRLEYVGTAQEQAKAMLCDPSGNFIEIKAYRQPQVVLGQLAERLGH